MSANPASRRFWPGLLAACGLVLALAAVALSIGRYPVGAGGVLRALTGAELEPVARAVVLELRLPRVLLALVVGAGLAAAGAAFQQLFRNPLASPDILGVSSGAALGASLALLVGLPALLVQGAAFVGGVGCVALVATIARVVKRHDPTLVLVLGGVTVGALAAALVALVKLVADPAGTLPAITFWLLGGLHAADPGGAGIAAGAIGVGVLALVALRWRLDLVTLPADEARSIGVELAGVRVVVIVFATLITAAAVSIAGVIGWVGLLVPHMARFMTGPQFARLLPVALLLGGAFLLAVDTLARSLIGTELPLGAVTALVGAPFFLWLLARGREAWR
ncbi:MAG: iron ABC transporter permease [Chromatiales bacterium]|nr:iron ABC transporter permease [Chromatiales bacterium]